MTSENFATRARFEAQQVKAEVPQTGACVFTFIPDTVLFDCRIRSVHALFRKLGTPLSVIYTDMTFIRALWGQNIYVILVGCMHFSIESDNVNQLLHNTFR